MRVLISTGEASGDAYGAALVRELSPLLPQADFSGTGSSRMRDAGARLIADSSSWGAVSISQALKVYPRVRMVYHRVTGELSDSPGLFIPIDFGYMNIRLARKAKARGWQVMYFVPPGSWRRDKQGRDLPPLTDQIVTPFSWSAEILNSMGAHAHWFGHPIRQLLADSGVDLHQQRETIAVLPGSRDHEIAANLPVIASVLAGRREPVEFGLAPSIDLPTFRERWITLSGRPNDQFTVGKAYEVLARARGAIVCSGTATLEAALCHCPMVVVYQLTRIMQVEAKLIRMKRPKFVALPNILLDRMAIPELVDTELSQATLERELDRLLQYPQDQQATFRELETLLGPSDAITRAAHLAASMLVQSPSFSIQ